jgi:hypothetical protein
VYPNVFTGGDKMRIVGLAVLSLVGVLGAAPSANADGWKGPLSQYLNANSNSSTAGVNRSQVDQINNNGNHFGQQNGQNGNTQNGNNGNHYGWDKNGNGQASQNTTYTGNTNGTSTNGKSVPGPDTLILLGAGLIGLVSWRNISRKVWSRTVKWKLKKQGLVLNEDRPFSFRRNNLHIIISRYASHLCEADSISSQLYLGMLELESGGALRSHHIHHSLLKAFL